jgi:antitoxin component of RelBE/YafQ-DinJ toxin-antitoxin module
MAAEDDKKTELVFARVGKYLKKRVQAHARKKRMDMSDVVRTALEEYFAKQDNLKKENDHGVL